MTADSRTTPDRQSPLPGSPEAHAQAIVRYLREQGYLG